MIELVNKKPIPTREEELLLAAFAAVTNNFQRDKFTPEHVHCFDRAPDTDIRLNGQTGFVRHFDVNKYMLDFLLTLKRGKDIKILDAPTSIGCAIYGLAAQSISYDFNSVTITGFDYSERFSELALLGKYPSIMTRLLWHKHIEMIFDEYETRRDFEKSHVFAKVKPIIRERVDLLPPQKIQDYDMAGDYDAVVLNNLFQYISDEDAQETLTKVVEREPSVIYFTKDKLKSIPSSLREAYVSIEDLPEAGGDEMDYRNKISMDYGFWMNSSHFNL